MKSDTRIPREMVITAAQLSVPTLAPSALPLAGGSQTDRARALPAAAQFSYRSNFTFRKKPAATGADARLFALMDTIERLAPEVNALIHHVSFALSNSREEKDAACRAVEIGLPSGSSRRS